MKYKVIKGFIDKYTGVPYDIGSLYDCTKERYNEIKASGNYLMPEPEKTAKKGTEKPKK